MENTKNETLKNNAGLNEKATTAGTEKDSSARTFLERVRTRKDLVEAVAEWCEVRRRSFPRYSETERLLYEAMASLGASVVALETLEQEVEGWLDGAGVPQGSFPFFHLEPWATKSNEAPVVWCPPGSVIRRMKWNAASETFDSETFQADKRGNVKKIEGVPPPLKATDLAAKNQPTPPDELPRKKSIGLEDLIAGGMAAQRAADEVLRAFHEKAEKNEASETRAAGDSPGAQRSGGLENLQSGQAPVGGVLLVPQGALQEFEAWLEGELAAYEFAGYGSSALLKKKSARKVAVAAFEAGFAASGKAVRS